MPFANSIHSFSWNWFIKDLVFESSNGKRYHWCWRI